GAGGSVVAWSEEATHFAGRLSIRGAGLGDGGVSEVSSRGELRYAGTMDESAEPGRAGKLLLDPKNLTVGDASTPFFAQQLPDPNPDASAFGTATAVGADANILVTDPSD